MKIVYYVRNISFPLHEGIRKQVWWMAQEMRALGHDVSIVTDGCRKRASEREGVRILSGYSLARITADVVHYISHPTPRILSLLFRAQARRHVMTIFDGALTGFGKRPWHRLVARTMNEKISCLTVQTDYQRDLLKSTSLRTPVRKIPPLIPKLERIGRRDKQPTILFMSHLHPSKGIDDVLSAYQQLTPSAPDLALTIADSGITSRTSALKAIHERAGRGITMRSIVDPAEELSRA